MNSTDKESVNIQTLYEGIFTQKQDYPTYEADINYTGKAKITKTPEGWKVQLFDPVSKLMKDSQAVLGELIHTSMQDRNQHVKKSMKDIKDKTKPIQPSKIESQGV